MNKTIKKIFGLAMGVTLVFGLAACGANSDTPEGAAEALLKDLQKGDEIVWQEKLTGKKLSDDEKKKIEKTRKENPDPLMDEMKDFDYKILDSKETKKGEEAEVNVEITANDFPKLVEKVNKKMMSKGAELAKMSKEEAKKEYNKEIKAAAKDLKKNVKNKVKLVAKYDKDKKEWKFGDLTKDVKLIDALEGGLITYMTNQLQKAMPTQPDASAQPDAGVQPDAGAQGGLENNQ